MGSPSEKSILPASTGHVSSSSQSTSPLNRYRKTIAIALSTFFIARCILLPIYDPSYQIFHIHHRNDAISCKQAELIYPKSFDVSSLVRGEKEQIVNWLSGAVKVPTEIFDVMGEVGEDPRWDAFYNLADCKSIFFHTLLLYCLCYVVPDEGM